ncbi:MAG: hypothetical protein ACI8S6_002673 [Myxococcota bacterium]|jgi:hypothetical protein
MAWSPAEIAAWDAHRLARVLSEVGGDSAPVGGGWMSCDVPGSWADCAAGLGVDRAVPEAVLDELVDFYAKRRRRASVVLTPYQHPELLPSLAARGFTLQSLETVLARPLTPLPPDPEPEGLQIVQVDGGDPDSVSAFVEAHLRGFFPAGDAPDGMRPIAARVAQSPRVRLWLLVEAGEVVGSGGLELLGEGAVLIAGSIMEGARRRGLHRAFIRHRLVFAAGEGCSFAVVGSIPNGPTERNALREGFSVAYTQITVAGPEP